MSADNGVGRDRHSLVVARWYDRASADLTTILTPKLTKGKLYTVRVVAHLADGRRIGRAEVGFCSSVQGQASLLSISSGVLAKYIGIE